MKRALVVATSLLALLGIAASVEHLVGGDHYNPGFVENPGLMRLHVILGAATWRSLCRSSCRGSGRGAALHRAFGRLAVAAGIVAGLTAIVISIAFPFSGVTETAVTLPFALLFVVSLGRGIWLARERRRCTASG
jgi:hypothetical protein